MASPSTTLNPLSGNSDVDGLLNGSHWDLDGSRIITWGIADNARYTWSDEAFSVRVIGSALAAIEAVANIHFVYTGHFSMPQLATSNITYNIGDSNLYGSTSVEGSAFFPNPWMTNVSLAGYGVTRAQYPNADGDVWYNNDYSSLATAANGPGSDVIHLVLHETGHALGLKHPHDGGANNRPTFTALGIGSLDNELYTVMSYNTVTGSNVAFGHAATPSVLDIAALQAVYGANSNTGSGNTGYSFTNDGAIRTIYDVSGSDWLDLSTAPGGAFINLTPGMFTSLRAGGPSVIGIAIGTVIEAALGGSGNDLIAGNAANNYIDGRAGVNTYFLQGAHASYQTVFSPGSITTVDTTPGRDGTDTLVNVQRLHFSDDMIAFDIQGDAGQAYRLYQAALHRTPEIAGVSYHANRLDNGVSLHDVAGGFIAAPEFAQLYGAAPTDQTFVRALYQNVLGRGPDAAGEAYYLGHLADRSMDRAAVLVGFSESPENHGRVDPTIAAGIHLDYGMMA